MKTLRIFMLCMLTLAVANVQAVTESNKVAKSASVAAVNDNMPTMAPEVQPRFVGGEQALFKFIENNLNQPKSAISDKIQGKVTVRVVITETGQVRSARVVKGVGCAQCDQEALRVVYAMPDWIPAQVQGRNVASYYAIPVTFDWKK